MIIKTLSTKGQYKDLIDQVYAILAYGPTQRPLYDTATEIVSLIKKELSKGSENSSPKFKGVVADDGYGPIEDYPAAPFAGAMRDE